MTYIYNPTEGGGSGTDKFLSSLGFNSGTGVLTATMNDSATRTVDLDGRYLEEVLEDLTPQLGGDLDLNNSEITGTGNINITGSGTLSGDLTIGTNTLYVDSTNNQVGIGTTTLAEALTVNGNVEADNFIGGLRGEVQFKAKSGEAISKGDPVYISSFDVTGNLPVVGIADANDSNKMPAFGLAESTVSLNASVNVVTFGTLSGIDTSSFSLGDILYISTSGTLTATKPTGESSLIQNIGKVIRVHASVGSIKVGGAGRANDVPNLNNGNVFIGSASNQPEKRSLTNSDVGLSNVPNINTSIASNISSGTLSDLRLSSNVTLEGNTFNGANQLVKTDATGKLPSLDGSQLTNIEFSNLPQASTEQQGIVELATNTETVALSDDTIAITPRSLQAYHDQYIFMQRYDSSTEFYSTNIDVEFPTGKINLGSGIWYSNGIFTLSKNCRLNINCCISWRNNGSPSDDTSVIAIAKKESGGTSYSTTPHLLINPSQLVTSYSEIVQTIESNLSFNSGDAFKIRIFDVSHSQIMVNKIINITEV